MEKARSFIARSIEVQEKAKKEEGLVVLKRSLDGMAIFIDN